MSATTYIPPVQQVPHWKRTNILLDFKFTPTEDQYQTLRFSQMRMGGFKHDFIRDVETREVTVTGRNKNQIIKDIQNFSPDAEISVSKTFPKFWRS